MAPKKTNKPEYLSSDELYFEYKSAAGLLTPVQVGCLQARGVSAEAMTALSGPARAAVDFNGRFYTPVNDAPESERSTLIFPAWRDEYLLDLVAWCPRTGRMAVRLGRECLLGFDCLHGWHDFLKPLRVFRDPLTWLVHDMEGLVVLEPEAVWQVLWRFEHFRTDDERHARELRALLTPKPRNVEIMFPRPCLSAGPPTPSLVADIGQPPDKGTLGVVGPKKVTKAEWEVKPITKKKDPQNETDPQHTKGAAQSPGADKTCSRVH